MDNARATGVMTRSDICPESIRDKLPMASRIDRARFGALHSHSEGRVTRVPDLFVDSRIIGTRVPRPARVFRDSRMPHSGWNNLLLTVRFSGLGLRHEIRN